MCTLLHISWLEDILAAIAEIPDGAVVRPHPEIRMGEEVDWDGVRIVHWSVVEPGAALVERIRRDLPGDGAVETGARYSRGYAIEAEGRRAIVGVDAGGEMYEEAVALVDTMLGGGR